MTNLTHQMIALLAALWILITHPTSVGPVIAILSIMAVMIGAMTPDLDQPAANMWRKMIGGPAIGRLFQLFSGGHRHFTHSLIGIVLIGGLLHLGIQTFLHPNFIQPALFIWMAFMIGYISHPLADTLTDRGVPWFWPFTLHIKIPPGPEELRVTTESIVENVIVRGGIIICFVLLLTKHWPVLAQLFS